MAELTVPAPGEDTVEIRHLDALLAIADEGSFTAAADALHTVQSNISQMVRQLEDELGVPLVERSRRGAEPTEFGEIVLARARHVRQELEAIQIDLSMRRGLETGHATLGTVGTISRWLVPAVVGDLRERASGVSLRVSEGASERLAADVAERDLAQAVLTEPVTDPRLAVEPVLIEDLVALVPIDVDLGAEAPVPLEVEGVRLIGDMVTAGVGLSIMPETAVPPQTTAARAVAIADLPPRRLALVQARGARLSLADRAVREAVIRIVGARDARPVRRGPTTVAGAVTGPDEEEP